MPWRYIFCLAAVAPGCLCIPLAASYAGAQRPAIPERVFSLPRAAFQTAASVRIGTTPSTLIVNSGDYPGEQIVAFDRCIGELRWSVPGSAIPAGTVGMDRWWLVGAAGGHGSTGVGVLLRLSGKPAPAPRELVGLEERTGRVRWRAALPFPGHASASTAFGIAGDFVTLTEPVSSSGSRESGKWQVTALDASTGQPVHPRARETAQAPLVLVQTSSYRPCILHLDTLRCVTPDVFPPGYGIGSTGTPIGIVAGRAIVHITTDDDGAGHSVWPRYLYCANAEGRKAWQYPRQLIFPGMSEKTDWKRYESIEEAALVASAGVVIAVSSRGELVGLEALAGRVAWRRRTPAQRILSMAAYRKGCFIIAGNGMGGSAADWLDYVNARTGSVRRIAALPGSRRLWVSGGELFVLTSKPTIEAYTCASLLSASTPHPNARGPRPLDCLPTMAEAWNEERVSGPIISRMRRPSPRRSCAVPPRTLPVTFKSQSRTVAGCSAGAPPRPRSPLSELSSPFTFPYTARNQDHGVRLRIHERPIPGTIPRPNLYSLWSTLRDGGLFRAAPVPR